MSIVLGIDFGNSSCKVGYATSTMLESMHVHTLTATPTVVSFLRQARLLGETGRLSRSFNFPNTVTSLKQLAGHSIQDAESLEGDVRFPNAVIADAGGVLGVKVEYNDHQEVFSNMQLVAMILHHIANVVRSSDTGTISQCVVTVPSWYSSAQKSAISDAACIAGIQHIGLIHDITAVVLRYGICHKALSNGTVAHYVVFIDIGESDTTVAVAAFSKDAVQIKSIVGDSDLGGRIIDYTVAMKLVKDGLMEREVLENPQAFLPILHVAQNMKEQLLAMETKGAAESGHGIPLFSIFQEIVSTVVQKVIQKVYEALKVACCSSAEIQHIELVGGCSKLHLIESSLKTQFPMVTVKLSSDFENGASIGATYAAALLQHNPHYSELFCKYPVHINWSIDVEGTPVLTTTKTPSYLLPLYNNEVQMHNIHCLHVSSILHYIGTSHYNLFQQNGDTEAIGKAVVFFQNAKDAASEMKSVELPSILNDLGLALQSHFEVKGDIRDLNRAVECQQSAVDLVSDDFVDKPAWLSNLGNALQTRFGNFHDVNDLEKSLSYKQDAVQMTLSGDFHEAARLTNLGITLNIHFQTLGDIKSLNGAIEVTESALKLTPEGHPHRTTILNNVANSLNIRFDHHGNIDDLHKAVEYQESALDQIQDENPNKGKILNNLGVRLVTLSKHTSDAKALNKAIICAQSAVKLCSEGNPFRASCLSNLGYALETQFEIMGDINDLEKAVTYKEIAMTLTPDAHSEKGIIANNLGTAFSTLFHQLGDIEMLDKAIMYFDKAMHLSPDSHTDRSAWLSNLGTALHTRFQRLGELYDLDKAVKCQKNALSLISDDDSNKATRLSNVANTLETRFKRLNHIDDISQAVTYAETAVKLSQKNVIQASCLSNLGKILETQFKILHHSEDIDQAIVSIQCAVDTVPNDHPHKAGYLSNLGIALDTRYCKFHDIQDLDRAVIYKESAVNLTPDDHPSKVDFLCNLGDTLEIRFNKAHNVLDLQAATAVFSKAAGLTGRPMSCFKGAVEWAACLHAFKVPSIDEIQRAYTAAFNILPQLAWVGTSMETQHYAVSHTGIMTSNAAAYALQLGDFTKAVEWLEQGRSFVWGQILQLHTSLDDLYKVDPELAKRLKSVNTKLDHNYSNTSDQANASDIVKFELEVIQQQHQAAREWNSLVAIVQQIPAFEKFLKPKAYTVLCEAAKNGPVVVLNITILRCDAMVLLPSKQIHNVALSDMTYHKAEQLQKSLESIISIHNARNGSRHIFTPENVDIDKEFRSILSELWLRVVKPIVDYLMLKKLPWKSEELPRIWWCPTGPLITLPLHAAGLYPKGQVDPEESLANYAISSYTPTLSALLRAASQPVCSTTKLLVVAQSQTPGVSPLPGTIKELENIQSIAEKNSIFICRAQDNNATVNTVHSGMMEYPWVHFACHALQDLQNPAESRLLLYDGHLTLSRIIRQPLSQADFAFMSACQTATGDKNAPEEAIHLAAGMLLAGYRGVIGTMWSIMDDDASSIAKEVYSHMLESPPDSLKASRALHLASQQLREFHGGNSFVFWVPYIHFGI